MRTQPAIASLLAAATVLAGAVALSTAAEARKQPRYYQPRAYQPYYYRPPRAYRSPRAYRAPRSYSWERLVCEENAQAADPTGLYAGYPCWARESFGRTPGGGQR